MPGWRFHDKKEAKAARRLGFSEKNNHHRKSRQPDKKVGIKNETIRRLN